MLLVMFPLLKWFQKKVLCRILVLVLYKVSPCYICLRIIQHTNRLTWPSSIVFNSFKGIFFYINKMLTNVPYLFIYSTEAKTGRSVNFFPFQSCCITGDSIWWAVDYCTFSRCSIEHLRWVHKGCIVLFLRPVLRSWAFLLGSGSRYFLSAPAPTIQAQLRPALAPKHKF